MKKFNGRKLQEMRILRGEKLEDVAKKAGFHLSSLSNWENGRRPQPDNLKKLSKYYNVPISVFFSILVLFLPNPAAASINQFDAVRAIVGEAADQPFSGMVAVAEVIRRRGGVDGLRGFHSEHVKSESPEIWGLAQIAWEVSISTDLSRGATLFENVYAFGFPESWDRYGVVCVAQLGDHWFFKED